MLNGVSNSDLEGISRIALEGISVMDVAQMILSQISETQPFSQSHNDDSG